MAWRAAGSRFRNLWLTPAQQGDRLMARGDFKTAAQRYPDSLRRGVALYRAGQFKEAAAEFGRSNLPEALFNRGNALVMTGKYQDAITSYDSALKQKPAWPEAIQNRDVAAARDKLLHPPNSGDEGTEGQLKADKIVFDNKPNQTPGAKETQVVSGGPMTDDQIQAMWLRKVKTTPADFLRAKFAYQLSRRDAEKSP
jgi:Ca-activated chloride channel family protein